MDEWVNAVFGPLAATFASWVFVAVPVAGTEVPLVVAWLVVGGLFFTVRLGFVNLRGMGIGIRLVLGRGVPAGRAGEVSHFQALATALSGTVGIGNIGGVAVAIGMGGPGAAFWLVLAGFLGMATKFAECTLGVRYRREHPDGTVSGGPMYTLDRGLASIGWPRSGRVLGRLYAIGIVIGCLGIGNMFQSNQAFEQLHAITGGASGPLHGRGGLVGLVLAGLTALTIIGGIRGIARVTQWLVPVMAVLYLGTAFWVLLAHAEALPWAFGQILAGALTGNAAAGGALGALVIGFQRAVFSNEAGIGSAAIAHSAVRTDIPVTEGYVALLEPFIDTVVICFTTSLVVITALYWIPDLAASGDGIAMTSTAFAHSVAWFPWPLAIAAMLFAYSTILAWSYYGLKGWTYLVGEGARRETAFKAVFCAFVVLGAMIELQSVLAFSDAMVFLICVPNLIGLYLLTPQIRAEMARWP